MIDLSHWHFINGITAPHISMGPSKWVNWKNLSWSIADIPDGAREQVHAHADGWHLPDSGMIYCEGCMRWTERVRRQDAAGIPDVTKRDAHIPAALPPLCHRCKRSEWDGKGRMHSCEPEWLVRESERDDYNEPTGFRKNNRELQ